MAFTELETKRYEKLVGQFIEKHRPSAEMRDKVDLSFRIAGQSIVIFEIRAILQKPGVKIESNVAKATYVKAQTCWKVYWQRADLKWHSYPPRPQVKSVQDFLALVEQDQHGCFWG
jgi:hypothetical protein